jgi:hypothetical protein
MNALTHAKQISVFLFFVIVSLFGRALAAPASDLSAAPVIYWSDQARRAIVPSSAGSENYGNKGPADGSVYMGIVHVAIYDAANAIEGGYQFYANYQPPLTAPHNASSAAAIATAAHHTLVGPPDTGLQPGLGLTLDQVNYLNGVYQIYMDAIPNGEPKRKGIQVGERVAQAIVTLRQNDGRDASPTLNPPPPGPGVWEPNPGNPPPPVVGLRLPGITPLALKRASQFRPDGPNDLTSNEYTGDFNQVKQLGRDTSASRTADQTAQALFWTDHDIRQWNDGLLRLVSEQGLDLVQAARMLAMAHVASADAMITCFEAKYHYWFWRPYQAIPRADTDGNPNTLADASWLPLRPTPNHPEYPSAHASYSGGGTRALAAFFGTNNIPFTLDSRVPGASPPRTYQNLRDIVSDVSQARVLVGFHFHNSCEDGANTGRTVGRYVAEHYFRPLD